MKDDPTICCIPVSWPTGLGELARMLTIALSVRERWHSARFHFVVNRNVPAAALARIPEEFGVTLLDTSPTCDDAGVEAALDRCRPDLVLFDNAGSGRQCRNAKRLGARTVFLSTRQVTRARGFQPSWLPWLDEHWLIEPLQLSSALPPGSSSRPPCRVPPYARCAPSSGRACPSGPSACAAGWDAPSARTSASSPAVVVAR